MGADGTSPAPVLDVQSALARLGGDESLYADFVRFFFEDAPPLLDKLRRAVQSNDAPAIRAHAHPLKNLLASCGATRATHTAQQLEDAGHSSNLAAAASLIEALDAELELLVPALAKYRR